ncbi:MAG: putative reductase [Subtercola sp.]|nr:putative reductase [Subtercola sp.]
MSGPFSRVGGTARPNWEGLLGDGIRMIARPVIEYLDRFDEGLAQIGEAVVDLPRRIFETFDEPVSLQSSQRVGEHLSGDASDEVDEFAVPTRLSTQSVDHERCPFVGKNLHHEPRGAVGEKHRIDRFMHVIHGTSG